MADPVGVNGLRFFFDNVWGVFSPVDDHSILFPQNSMKMLCLNLFKHLLIIEITGLPESVGNVYLC